MKIALSIISLIIFHVASARNAVVTEYENALNLSPYSEAYVDSTNNMTLDDVIGISEWEKAGRQGLNLGIARHPVWIHVDLMNNERDTTSRYVFLPYHHLEYVDFYIVRNDSVREHLATGTVRLYSNKPEEIRGYPFKIDIPPGESSQLYVRIDHRNLPLRANLFLLKEQELHNTNNKLLGLMWFWKGVIFAAALLSLITFFFIKSRLFLYYCLLLIGIILFIGAEIGDYFQFFNADPNNRIIDIKHLGNILVIFSFPMFVNEMCPVRKLHPNLWKWTMWLIIPMAVMFILVLFKPVKESDVLLIITHYAIIVSPIIFFMQLVFLSSAAVRRVNNAALLLSIYAVYIFIFLITNSLPNLGAISLGSMNVYGLLLVSSMLEVLTFMILVARETFMVYRHRTRLIEESKEHEKNLLLATVHSQEEERNRVGRELHDMVGANMAVIKQKVDKQDRELRDILHHTIEATRNLSHGLTTPHVRKNEFIDEISELCILSSTETLRIQSFFTDWDQFEGNKEVCTHLYRIVQELIQNALKHSQGSKAIFQFIVDSGNINLLYDDNGVGISNLDKSRKGIGLNNIESRVELLHGTIRYKEQFVIEGVSIHIEIPI